MPGTIRELRPTPRSADRTCRELSAPAPGADRVGDDERLVVSLLLRNPRLSADSLARAVGKTPQQTRTILHRLRDSGALRGCRAVVREPDTRPAPDNGAPTAFLAIQTLRLEEFQEALGRLGGEDIHAVHTVAGRCDTVVRVADPEGVGRSVARLLDGDHDRGRPSSRMEIAVVQRRYDKVHCVPRPGAGA